MKMQSVVFSRFDPTSEANKVFCKDLKTLVSISSEQRRLCLEGYPDVRLAQTSDEEGKATKRITDKSELTQIDTNAVLSIFNYFLRMMEAITDDEDFAEDSPEKWALDLITLGLLTEGEKPSFVETLIQLQSEVIPKVLPIIQQYRSTVGVFPVFKQLETTVELRAVQKQEYSSGQNPDDYIPQILDLVPIASIHLGMHKGHPSDVYFQVDEDDVGRLRDAFHALKKEMDALKKHNLGIHERLKES